MPHAITPLVALVLGVVEGITEYLPVSSTGHLILTGHLLGLPNKPGDNPVVMGVKAYEVVIQAGALLAVLGLYRPHVLRMIDGLFGKDSAGRKLLIQLIIAFLPAAFFGVLFGKAIKRHLFGPSWPIVTAFAVGGVAMILVERWRAARVGPHTAADGAIRTDLDVSSVRFGHFTLEHMTIPYALLIGVAQSLALWPGTSRSMVTILAGLLLGFTPVAAAEFSFLLALPTLGAATAKDFLDSRHDLMLASGPLGLAIGFVVSFIVAWIAVKAFIHFLNRHGLTPFGIYRLIAAVVVLLLWPK